MSKVEITDVPRETLTTAQHVERLQELSKMDGKVGVGNLFKAIFETLIVLMEDKARREAPLPIGVGQSASKQRKATG